jgi:hypothetical protein
MATEEPGIHIHPARPSDAATLTEVAHQAKRSWGYPEEFLALWRDALTVTATLLARSDTFVAVDGKRILGFISVERIGSVPSVPEGRTLPRLRWQPAAQAPADPL